VADHFDSDGQMHVTLLDDGSVQLTTVDVRLFPLLLLHFQGGQFTVRFHRQGGSEMRGYTVTAGMSATAAASTKFQACLKDFVSQFPH
jgi:hypothetical protein